MLNYYVDCCSFLGKITYSLLPFRDSKPNDTLNQPEYEVTFSEGVILAQTFGYVQYENGKGGKNIHTQADCKTI